MATGARRPVHDDTDGFRGKISEEHFLALETLHRSEGSAWLGRDLRQMGIGAKLDYSIPTMSRARVWTNSFTVATHIQPEAITKEGPLHSKEFYLLLETAIQGEACSRTRQFAQRLRDTADEELVAPRETFVAAAHREPDFAEELDRADEAAESEVDEETPSPAQQRHLLRAHANLGHPTIGEFCRKKDRCCGMADATEESSDVQNVISNVQSARHRTSTRTRFPLGRTRPRVSKCRARLKRVDQEDLPPVD